MPTPRVYPFSTAARLALVAVLLSLSAPVCAGESARAVLISSFRDASSGDRVALVEAAVEALSDRFLAAAGAGQADASWRRATRDFVVDLWRAVDAARAGVPIALVDDGVEGLRVVVGSVDARQFALSPPRPAEIAALETDVLRRWCEHITCAGRAAPTLAAAAAAGLEAAAPATRTPASTFEPVPGAVSDGLACRPGGRHRRLQATACAALLAEIRAVVAALDAQVQAGIEVDRDALANAVWRDGGRRLVVGGRHGRSIAVDAPLLGRFPHLFGTLLPWIAERLTGKVQPLTIEPPARLVYAGAAAAL